MAVANSSPVNPVVFFDVSIGGQDTRGAPSTGKTFETYALFHLYNVVKLGNFTGKFWSFGDGTGVASIYRGPFADENFKLRHSAPGLLSMANSGPSTNGCQFFITCSKCDWLDGKHVVFGKIIDGLLVMRKIENVPTGPNNKPKLPVVISQCGEM
ncbi:hypothetical protein FD754_003895 [Muntiacus muntjak]|uniref:Peptidyl-prolyl cis-trans isomerase n=1 Tax=Muntiacus muntjak TaxID=9888 RepID=A0A5N3WDC7_MUNMU|nr:hypothetical protein FD754_003895 [Muntiacus muntjak]